MAHARALVARRPHWVIREPALLARNYPGIWGILCFAKTSFTMTRSLRLLARRCSSIVRLGTDDPRMSKVVIHRGVVYTSGQTAADAGDCVEKQTKSCLAKIDALLAEAGTSKSNALNATIWLKDIEADFKRMNGVWNEWVEADNKPTRATVQAAMARPSILVEIQVTAALPE